MAHEPVLRGWLEKASEGLGIAFILMAISRLASVSIWTMGRHRSRHDSAIGNPPL